jgi:hypothetical protein
MTLTRIDRIRRTADKFGAMLAAADNAGVPELRALRAKIDEKIAAAETKQGREAQEARNLRKDVGTLRGL